MTGEELILKYISEGLTRDERFQLEKLALTDDFIAEAWEGLSSSSANHQEMYLRIQQRLRRDQEARVIPMYKKMWPYAIAASIVAIFAVTALLRQPDSQLRDTESGTQIENSDLVALSVPALEEEQTLQSDSKLISEPKNEESQVKSSQKNGSQKPKDNKPIGRSENIRASATSSGDVASIMKSQEDMHKTAMQSKSKDNVQMPVAEAVSTDQLANALTEEKLDELADDETPMKIPNSEDAKSLKPVPQNFLSRSKKAKVDSPLSKPVENNDIEFSAFADVKRSELNKSDNRVQEMSTDTTPFYNLDIDKSRKALKMEKDPVAQAKHHFTIASILFRIENKYQEAKDELQNAMRLDPEWGQPYVLLGDIYSKTARNCGDAWNQSMAVLAAYDQWLMAKSKNLDANTLTNVDAKLERYRAFFPKAEDGFMRGIKQGDQVTVGCWIEELVVVRFK